MYFFWKSKVGLNKCNPFTFDVTDCSIPPHFRQVRLPQSAHTFCPSCIFPSLIMSSLVRQIGQSGESFFISPAAAATSLVRRTTSDVNSTYSSSSFLKMKEGIVFFFTVEKVYSVIQSKTFKTTATTQVRKTLLLNNQTPFGIIGKTAKGITWKWIADRGLEGAA